ncbi:MAG: hypothetical protein ACYCXK_00370 [Candidatus Humimicrobiaceae bacterium]
MISEKKSFEKVFVDPGIHIVALEIKDPASRLVKEQSFSINVYRPYIELLDGGRKIVSNCSMFIDEKYNIDEVDVDKDGINQAWEDETMLSINPYYELDEEEDWLQHYDTDKVANFVRIMPYPSVSDPQYIVFIYCTAWTRDYGRYLDVELPGYNIFKAHNGDVETTAMAWKVVDDNNLELMYVYTSAHGSEETSHSAVWNATGETCNKGKVKFGPNETFCAALEFDNNILKLQSSEDKHAIYPTAACGDSIILLINIFDTGVGEDCGGGGQYRFSSYNAGEPDAHLMDDIGYIFSNERIWSGNKSKPGKFCGGLEANDSCPGTIEAVFQGFHQS